LQQQLFEKCFFIRYKDEFPHLRIRFYQPDRQKRAILQDEWTQWLQPLLNDGLVDRVVMDTYMRELERYGATVIEEVEQLFCNDSLAVLRVLSLLDDTDTEAYRLLLALRGIDVMLDDCNLALQQKAALAKQLRDGFFKEFGASPLLQKQLNEKYRHYQQRIFTHMQPFNDQTNGIAEAIAAFGCRSNMNKPVLETMLAKIPAQALTALLPSFIHMFMNRLFIAEQRKYELVVYHFLEKYYASQLAITQPGKSSQAGAAGHGAVPLHNNLET
jgi:thiopeptide-type bacteriocin biosynthesis protein